MKTSRFNKQSALKGLLLLALAANVSWNAFMGGERGNIDLLQTAPSVEVKTGQPAAPAAEASKTQPAEENCNTLKSPVEYKKQVTICGKPARVTFRYYCKKSDLTLFYAEHFDAERGCENKEDCFSKIGKPVNLATSFEEISTQQDKYAKIGIRDLETRECKDKAEKNKAAEAETKTGENGEKVSAEQERKDNEEGVKECRLRKEGSTYVALSDKAQTRCQIQRIRSLSSKKYRPNELKEKKTDDLNKLVEEIRPMIRNLVSSSDNSEISEGISMAKEADLAISQAASGIDSNRIRDLREEFKGYASLGEVTRQKDKLDKERDTVKRELKEAGNEYGKTQREFARVNALYNTPAGRADWAVQIRRNELIQELEDQKGRFEDAYDRYGTFKTRFSDFRTKELASLSQFSRHIPRELYKSSLETFDSIAKDINLMQNPYQFILGRGYSSGSLLYGSLDSSMIEYRRAANNRAVARGGAVDFTRPTLSFAGNVVPNVNTDFQFGLRNNNVPFNNGAFRTAPANNFNNGVRGPLFRQ